MAETRTTWAVLLAQFADNTAGAISAEDLRDFVASARPFVTTTAPTASDDETLGFDVGHGWLDVTGPTLYECVDAATGAAVWVQVYPASSSTAWGGITGTLTDQTDLVSALGLKADSSSLGTAAAADVGDFATAAQGSLAASAVQPGDDAADLGSGASTDGHVLTSDGAGGAEWEAVPGASAFTDLADAPASYSGQGGKLVAVNSGATALEFVTGGGSGGNDYYDLQLGFLGVPDAGAVDVVLSARAVTIDDADPGEVFVGTNPTSAATITINKNGVSVGSISITTGGVASWTVGADIVLTKGDRLSLVAPSPADATLAGVLVAFRGTAA